MNYGILNINKPAGWTSQDVCAKLRRRLHIKRIGHTGTLDPMATGVLPVCMGKATRIIEYYDRDLKSYHAAMQLGITTDTLDITGEVTGRSGFGMVREQDITDAFAAYTGRIAQIPPKYSALKINGKRAYDLARLGQDFELRSREITIESNTVSMIDLERGVIEFDVTCSKGTYIRTICDDIGRTLGCGAAMTGLVRTANGYFRLEDALDLEKLIEMDDGSIERSVIPMDVTLISLGRIELDLRRADAFRSGNSSSAWSYRVTEPSSFDGISRIYSEGIFLGTGHIEGDQLVPDKVIDTGQRTAG